MCLKSRVKAKNASDLCDCELPGLETLERYPFQNSALNIPALVCEYIIRKKDCNGHSHLTSSALNLPPVTVSSWRDRSFQPIASAATESIVRFHSVWAFRGDNISRHSGKH